MKDVRSGVFKEATEEERVLELKEFLTRLKNPTLIDATNASIRSEEHTSELQSR